MKLFPNKPNKPVIGDCYYDNDGLLFTFIGNAWVEFTYSLYSDRDSNLNLIINMLENDPELWNILLRKMRNKKINNILNE